MAKRSKKRTSGPPRLRLPAPRSSKKRSGNKPRSAEAERKTVARLTRELSEALEQQAATAEVLGIVSSSPGELDPVFQTILANATRLCEASYGAMWLREGDSFRNAAFYGALQAAYVEQWKSATVGRTAPMGRVAQSKEPLHLSRRASIDCHRRRSRRHPNLGPRPHAQGGGVHRGHLHLS